MVPGGIFTWSDRAIKEATELELDPSDVISATYPKTGACHVSRLFREKDPGQRQGIQGRPEPSRNLLQTYDLRVGVSHRNFFSEQGCSKLLSLVIQSRRLSHSQNGSFLPCFSNSKFGPNAGTLD